MLQRVRDLAVQFNNGTLSTPDKAAITLEVSQLCAEIDRIGTRPSSTASRCSPAASDHLPGRRQRQRDPQRHRRSLFGSGDQLRRRLLDLRFSGTVTLASIDAAIDNVSTARSTFGSVQNRLEHTLNNLASYEENLTASESRIRDVDMATEMVQLHQVADPAAGRHLDAGPGQPAQSVLSLLR